MYIFTSASSTDLPENNAVACDPKRIEFQTVSKTNATLVIRRFIVMDYL